MKKQLTFLGFIAALTLNIPAHAQYYPPSGGGGGGSITSVGISAPSYFTVGGSPITTGAGTLSLTGSSQTANMVLAAPNGSAGPLSVRSLVGADLPVINLAISTAGGVTGTLPGANMSATNLAAIGNGGVTGVLPTASGGVGSGTAPIVGQVHIATSTSAYTPTTISGDATLASTGALTVTKTNGVAFSTLATAATAAVANGGTGLTATPTNGQIDIGNGAGFTRTTLTQGTNITITNSAGGITIAASGGSGSVTSAGMTGDGVLYNSTVTGSPIITTGTLVPSLLTQASHSFFGVPGASTLAPSFMTAAQAAAALPLATTSTQGLAPVLSNVATQFLNGTGAYSTPSGGGSSFGGDGSSGAISYSTNQTPTGPLQLNATTIVTSGTTTYVPTAGPIIWNANSTVTIASGTTITIDGLGGAGGTATTTSYTGSDGGGLGGAAGGYAGGSSGSATNAGSGGGYGGLGGFGGGSAYNGSFSPGNTYPFSLLGGSGGSGGAAGTLAAGSAGGPGGGTFLVNSVGNLTVAGIISNKGSAGGSVGIWGGGGGSGGSVGLNSKGQISVTGTINVSGGAGGTGSSYGGGGGAAGRILGISTTAPSITGTITTGGGAAGTGGSTPAPSAGGASTAVWITATPNLPLIGWLYGPERGIDKVFDAIKEGKSPFVRELASRINKVDGKGTFMEGREFLKIAAQGDLNQFVKLATETASEPGESLTCLGIVDSALPEELANAT